MESNSMIENSLIEILKSCDSVSPYQKRKIEQECKSIAIAYNNSQTRLNRALNVENSTSLSYELWQSKMVAVSQLHGYTGEFCFDYLTDDFVKWMMANVNSKYNGKEITNTMLEAMSFDYKCFYLDHNREPNDYNEFRKYIINRKDD